MARNCGPFSLWEAGFDRLVRVGRPPREPSHGSGAADYGPQAGLIQDDLGRLDR